MASCSQCACETFLKSGEVGLDADNAKAQAFVDSEVLAAEEAGHWGGFSAEDKAAAARQKAHDRFSKLGGRSGGRGKVGQNAWVEDKDWWKDHAEHLDGGHAESARDKVHSMTKEELRAYKKVRARGPSGREL